MGKGAGTVLEPGDIFAPPKGAGVGIMQIGGPDDGVMFIIKKPTRVPSVVQLPTPKGRKISLYKIFVGTIKSKIKFLLKGDKYNVETENACTGPLGTAYQVITSPSGDEITVLEGRTY